MTTIESISSKLTDRFAQSKNAYNTAKVMVIVDEKHLDILDEMMVEKKWGLQVVYILTDAPAVRCMFPDHSRVYPTRANIRSLLRFDIIDEIVCCTSTLPADIMRNLVEICNQFGVSLLVRTMPHQLRLPVSGSAVVAGYHFRVLETNPKGKFGFILKSIAEITFATVVIGLLSPFLLLIAALIKTTSEGPVIFKQQRVGLRGRKFYIYKFRTMVADAEKLKASLADLNESDGPAFKIARDPRITGVGRFLRKTGLDEIPQLFNVMRGEMSLIGPRPMLPGEVSAQQEWQLKRMCIKPGITCTWQIQPNRNKVPFDKWMQLDREYVENWSLFTDIKIFFYTVRSIFAARGL